LDKHDIKVREEKFRKEKEDPYTLLGNDYIVDLYATDLDPYNFSIIFNSLKMNKFKTPQDTLYKVKPHNLYGKVSLQASEMQDAMLHLTSLMKCLENRNAKPEAICLLVAGSSLEDFNYAVRKITFDFPRFYSKWYKTLYFLHLPFITDDNTKNIKDFISNLARENNGLRNQINELSKEKKMVIQDFNNVIQRYKELENEHEITKRMWKKL